MTHVESWPPLCCSKFPLVMGWVMVMVWVADACYDRDTMTMYMDVQPAQGGSSSDNRWCISPSTPSYIIRAMREPRPPPWC